MKAKAKVASKNIVVYKRFDVTETSIPNYGHGEIYLSSPHRNFRYEPNRMVKATFGIEVIRSQNVIGKRYYSAQVFQGLHSHRTMGDARCDQSTGHVIAKAIIPKGAKYHYNEGEIVSTRLFLTDVVFTTNASWARSKMKKAGYRVMTIEKALKVKHVIPKNSWSIGT